MFSSLFCSCSQRTLILDRLPDDARCLAKCAASIATLHHFIESSAGSLWIVCLRSIAIFVSL